MEMGYQSLFVIRYAFGTTDVFDIYIYMAAIQVLFFFFLIIFFRSDSLLNTVVSNPEQSHKLFNLNKSQMWLRMSAKQLWHILVPVSRILQANASRVLPAGSKRKSMQIKAVSQENNLCGQVSA